LVDHLTRSLEAEEIEVPRTVVALVAREAEGSVRDAQSLLEQVLAAGGAGIDEEAARGLLGAADRRLVVDVCGAMMRRDADACLRRLGTLFEHGYDAQRFCKDLLEFVRHLAVVATTGDRGLLRDLAETEVDAIMALSADCSPDDAQRAFGLLLDADAALAISARSIEPQLVLEMAILRIATLPPLVPVPELLERLEALERGGQPPAAASGGGGGGTPRSERAGRPVGGASVSASGATRADAATGGEWRAFLECVRREKLALYLALASGRLVSLDERVMRIGIDSEAMRRDLSRRDVVDRLERIARDVVGREVTVEVGVIPVAEETPRDRARQRERDSRAHPLVQYAVELFGGEVRGSRERRPGREGS
jgi:DNA polymerase III subunit gamma/tau